MEIKTLHIFNPEHDIALASNLANFTAPHAGRLLAEDLGFLPALWAAPGDAVWVGDADYARKAFRRFLRSSHLKIEEPHWVTRRTLATTALERIDPWGWDAALRCQLLRYGAETALLQGLEALDEIRLLSHRQTARRLLPQLRQEGTVGEAFQCRQVEEVGELLRRYGSLVLKSPWSSSGRGIRFVDGALSDHHIGWLRNLLNRQGSVMAEPYYDKVKDFGMEFECDGQGHVRYLGLSLFHTLNGAYVGNILATEKTKRQLLARLVPEGLLDAVRQRIAARLELGNYQGPFGVDMMVVKGNAAGSGPCLLHPCVEINLRRTMGHVALALSPDDDDIRRVMRVAYEGNHYKLKISKLR